jgi:serine/threonine protein kinase
MNPSGDFAVVMEYLPLTLEEIINKDLGMITRNFISEILANVLEGLRFLHSVNVIHRDIKPANILIKLTEAGFSVKLIDFSISKVVSERGVDILADFFSTGIMDFDSNRLTKNVTTRPYRAPEVALMTNYSFKIDIWALGCILAELILIEIGKFQFRRLLFQAQICLPLNALPLNLAVL